MDAARLARRIEELLPADAALGRPLTVVDETSSAADLAWASDASAGAAFLALSQTRGRGRRGHAWKGGQGVSVMLSVRWTAVASAQLRMVAAATLAAADAARRFGAPCRIKWPNDVLVEDRKLAGILVEYRGGPMAVVSIGLNVSQTEFPGALRETATSLALAAPPGPALAEASSACLEALALRLAQAAREPTALDTQFSDALALGAGPVRLVAGGREVVGTLGDMPLDGSWTVDTEDGAVLVEPGHMTALGPA